tara:strand:+ start:446 stop:826 length:381 start_codon:yes stop_codon:yes gene_type:complete
MNKQEQLIIETIQTISKVSDITKKGRKRDVVDARRLAYTVFRDIYNYTYQRIARIFNNDHATIIHGYKSAQDLLEVDKEFRNNYNRCLDLLSGGRADRIRKEIMHLQEELLTIELREKQQDSYNNN